MIPANNPAETDLAEFVKLCGSKRSAAKACGIPRKTLCRWLLDIERTGKINARPSRVRWAMERINAVRAKMRQDEHCYDVADAFMSIFGFHRAGRGDDMTCASFPDNFGDVSNSQTANGEKKERVNAKCVHKSRIADEKARKRKTVLFLYDIHLPNHSEENIALALDYAQLRHEIDTVVIGGDFLDCAGISRWKKDPYGTMPLHEEIARGVAWLEALRARFKKSEIVILKGNHEDRLQSYLWNQAAEISKLKGLRLQDQLELERLNIRWVDNLDRVQRGEGVYSIGKLNILHGNELGICPNVGPARQYFLRALENVICGHVHRVDDYIARTVTGDTKGAWVCGALCDMTPAYRPLNPWTAGFAIVHFDDDGLFSVKNKKIIESRVL